MMKEETLAKPLMPTLQSNEAMVRHFPYPSSSTLNRGGVCGRGESTPIPTCEFHGQTPQEEDSDGWISAVEDELQLDTVCNKKLPHLSDGGDFGCVSFVDAPDTFLDADSEPPAPSLYLQRTVSDDSGSFTMECTSPLTPASSLCSEISFESWCNEEAYDSSSVPMAYRLPTQRATHDPKPRKGRNQDAQNAINGSRKYADTLSYFPSDSSNMHKRYEKTQIKPSELRETIRNVRPIGNQRYSQPKRTHVMKLDAGRSCNHSFLEMKTRQDNGTNGLQLKTCQRNQQEKIFRFSSAEFPMFFRQDSTSSKEMYRFCKGNVSLLRSISDLTETSPRRAAHVRSRSMSDGQWRDSDEGLRTLLRRKKRSLVEELLTKIYCSHLGDGRHSSQSSDTEWSVQSETERERLNESILRNKDVEELSVLVKQLKDHVHQIAADLVRHLTRRDNLRNKRDRNYDVVTAILQAVSPKRCVDTRMRFSVEPRSGDSGFIQWHDAMKMVARLPGGIPADFRKRLWLTMSEKHLQTRQVDWEQAKRFCFNDRSNPDDDELGTQIVKDLHRTGCSLFCGEDAEHNQALLKRVLLAYARWNKNVGYCQGFNMLAALILEVTDRREEDALKVMIYLIEGVLPESYFANSLRGLSVDMAVFRDLLRLRLPNLSRHLDTLQAEARDATSGASYEPPLTNVFTMQWFLTLFSNCLPKSTVLRVWDLIFLEGNEVLLRTALAIWDGLSDRIMTVESADEFYSIMRVLTREMLEFGLMDANHLVKTICVLAPFPFPQLAELRDKYTYNITPFTAAIGMAKRAGLRLFYSDDEEEDDDQMAVAAWCFSSVPPHQIKARVSLTGEGGLHPAVSPNSAANFNTIGPGAFGPSAAVFPAPSQPTVDIDRMSLDISALKKQYAKLKERQKQAHVILTSAARMPKATSHRPPPIAVNHLLVGKKPLTSKRSTAQKGTIHLVVQNKPAPMKPIKSKSQQVSPQPHESGETLFWNKAKHDRRMSLQETIDIQRITTKKVEEIDEDSSSSTSTELCDEDRGSLSDFGSEMDDSESSGLAVRVAAVRDAKNPSKIGSETSSSDSAADGALSLTAIGEPSADDCSSSDRLDESSVTTVTSDETLCPRVDTSQTKWWYLSEDGAAGGVEEPAADPGKEIPSPDWATEKLQEKKDSSSSSSLSSNQHDDSSSSSFTRWLASVDKGNSSSPSTNPDLEKSKSGDSLSSDSDIKAWVQGLDKSSINETNSEVNVNSKSQCETETALQDVVDVNISDQRSGEMDHGTDKDQSECYSDTLQPRSADTVDTGFSSSEFKFDLDVSVPREDQDRASMAIVAMQTEDSGRASSAETDSAKQSRVSEPSTEVGEGPAAQSPLDLEALNFKLSSSSSSEGSSSVDGYQKGDCESETDAKISEILAWTAFTFDESKDEEDKDDDSKSREPESSCIPARPSLSTQSRWSLPEGDVTLASLQRHSWSSMHPVTEQQDAESRRFSEGDKTNDTLQRLQGAHAKDTHATLQRTGSSPACNGKDNKAKKTKNLVSSISLQSPTAPITFNPFPTLRRAPSEVGVKLGLYTSPGNQKSDKSSKSSSSPTKGRFFW